MSIKVAITSTDGVNIDRHFGRARHFVIYRWDGASFGFDAKREVPPLCGDPEGHGENLDEALDRFLDCRFVLAVTAGPAVMRGFAERNIFFLPVEDEIQTALARLPQSVMFRKLFQRSPINV